MSTDESVTVWIEAYINRFIAPMNLFACQVAEIARLTDAPRRRTAMHAAYKAKTRRRNRR